VIPNATDDVGHIHDRMPMTVARDNWTYWVDRRCRIARQGRPVFVHGTATIDTWTNNETGGRPEQLGVAGAVPVDGGRR
jgi:putative SOS response-associated peptidase YedK